MAGFQPFASSVFTPWGSFDEFTDSQQDSQTVVPSTQTSRPPKLQVTRPVAKRSNPNMAFVDDAVESQTPPPSKRVCMMMENNPEDVSHVQAQTNAGNISKAKGKRWKDIWVSRLIEIRGGMHDYFSKPPKQGIDLWHKLFVKLCSRCPDFDKDAESCRKKWKAVYADYREDKTANSISGNGRSSKCRWYNEVDAIMQDRAHVVCHAHASANDNNEKSPPSHVKSSAEHSPLTPEASDGTKHVCNEPTSLKKAKGKDQYHETLIDLTNNSSRMVDVVERSESQKIEIMKSMQEILATLAMKL